MANAYRVEYDKTEIRHVTRRGAALRLAADALECGHAVSIIPVEVKPVSKEDEERIDRAVRAGVEG